MIFFGSKGKTVSGPLIEGIQCQNCENSQFITFGIIRYFHLYWIPTFPTSKKAGIECTNCKRTLVDKELPAELSKQIKTTVFNRKNTIPMFSGLIIIACLVLFGAFVVQQDSMRQVEYIEKPAINDLYIVDISKLFTDADPEYKYGVLRISQISSGEAEFQVSRIAYTKTSGVRKDIQERKASVDSYYVGEPLFIAIDRLKNMKDSGAIYSIERI